MAANNKIRKIFIFLRLLTVEPIAFLSLFAYMIKSIPSDQMVQDKICMQKYHLADDYCHRLPQMSDEEDYLRKKSSILTDVTQFNMYVNFVITLPLVIISIMIGPFIDKCPPAKRYLFIYSSVVIFIESFMYVLNAYFFNLSYYFVLLTKVFSSCSGGLLVMLTTQWAYLTSVTPKHMTSTRMALIEIIIAMGQPIATAGAGFLLQLNPLFVGHEPRNFSSVFLVGCASALLMLMISLLLIDEEKDRQLFAKHFPAPVLSNKKKKKSIDNDSIDGGSSRKESFKPSLPSPSRSPSPSLTPPPPPQPPQTIGSVLRLLFDFNNVRDMANTFTKKRRHNIRTQIILIILSTMALLLAYLGPSVFLYQYVEKVFSWNATIYSNFVSISSLINISSTFILAPIMLNVLKISDLHISLLAYHMIFITNIIRLMSKSVVAFYATLPFYTVNSLGMVGARSYLTKIIEPNELGRIFALMSTIDSSLPVITSAIFSPLFRATIDNNPNLSFSAVCVAMVVGIVLLFIVARQGKRTLALIEQDRENSGVIGGGNNAKMSITNIGDEGEVV